MPDGYDPLFLPVPVPAPRTGVAVRELPFVHFTVVLEPARRLAVVTAANLDGDRLVDLGRGDDWHLDPRVPAGEQTGPQVYADNDLDRGHLTRRRDPVWGDQAEARRANFDTFSYVNAAPQAALFNQGELLWSGLEDYVLQYAETWRQRLSVFTAPVLGQGDPPYRGIRIPRKFWKIVAWAAAGQEGHPELAATGYVLDQSPQLDLIDLTDRRPVVPAEPPPLGAYLTYQVPLADIAALTGLDLGPLIAADRLPAPQPVPAAQAAAGAPVGWTLLQQLGDVTL